MSNRSDYLQHNRFNFDTDKEGDSADLSSQSLLFISDCHQITLQFLHLFLLHTHGIVQGLILLSQHTDLLLQAAASPMVALDGVVTAGSVCVSWRPVSGGRGQGP